MRIQIRELTPANLRAHHVWMRDGDQVSSFDGAPANDGRVFILAVVFTFPDGAEYDGYCSVCDPDGPGFMEPVVVTARGHLPFVWKSPPPEVPETLARRILSKAAGDLFPVRYAARVACYEHGDTPFSGVLRAFDVPRAPRG